MATRRTRGEPARTEREPLAQAILESAALGIVVVGEEGTITLVNAKIEETFGFLRARS